MKSADPIYDVVVVGLGGMGSAIAANAARRGLLVLGLEQFTPVHDLGASTGRSRIIRKAYFEDPAYVPLLIRAYELWRELEAHTGIEVMQLPGVLMVGQPDSPLLTGARISATLHDLRLEDLSAKEVHERFPMTRLIQGEVAVFEPEAGFIRPEAAIEAHLRVAKGHGATLKFGSRVSDWVVLGDDLINVVVETGACFKTRKLVLSIGPWFVDYAAAIGVQLRVQRNVQAWFRADDASFSLQSLPAFFVDRPYFPQRMYGFPNIGGGVKVAFHGHGETTAPSSLRRDVEPDEIDELRLALLDWLPGVHGELLAAKVCMYSLTPDEHFVIAPHPEAANVIVAGGFSGHGYKFCTVVGEIVSDLVERGTSRHDIEFLSPLRFTRVRDRLDTTLNP